MKLIGVDHYCVLGLPSGLEGIKLSKQHISKAFRLKSLELHPDKRHNDPNAHENFLKLTASYTILNDENSRKLFDDRLVQCHQQRCQKPRCSSQSDAAKKRKRAVSDLEQREDGSSLSSGAAARVRQDRTYKEQLKEQIQRVCEMHAKERTCYSVPLVKKAAAGKRKKVTRVLDGEDERVLEVKWLRGGGLVDYGTDRLREVFTKFGGVEDILLKFSKNGGSALVVMASRDAVLAATRTVCGDPSNPLLVLPLAASTPTKFPTARHFNVSGFPEREANVLQKLLRTGEVFKVKREMVDLQPEVASR